MHFKTNCNLYFLLVCAVSSSLFHSCNKENDQNSVLPIRSDLLISLKFSNPYSIYDSYILVETSDDYGCFNYSISYQSQLVDGVNELIFENILKNGGCQRLVGPATVEIPIDTSQTLNFKMKLKRKWYTGKVENGEISLDNPGRIKLKD